VAGDALMSQVVASFVTGEQKFCDAAIQWVRSVRYWAGFSGDIILFMDESMDLPGDVENFIDRRPAEPVCEAAANCGLDLFRCAYKPFLVHSALHGRAPNDVVLIADIDALAVSSLQPMFDRCAETGKIMAPHDRPGDGKTIANSHSRGYFSEDELERCDELGMEAVCAGFLIGSAGNLRAMTNDWLTIMQTKECKPVERPGMQDQAALNYWLFQHTDSWEPTGRWIFPFDGPVWQRPDRDICIWHFHQHQLEKQSKIYAMRMGTRALW
jgi:hypothetical protein